MGDTPKFKITRQPQEVTLLRQITPLDGPPKTSGNRKFYMVILDNQGEENMLFLSVPEKKSLVEAGVSNSSRFRIWREPTGEYDQQNRAITNVAVELTSGGSAPQQPAASPPPRREQPSATVPNDDDVTYLDRSGWVTSSFDNKLTPNLAMVPTTFDTAQEKIFRRICNGVGDELAHVARAKSLLMSGLDPDVRLTPAQAATMAPAIQSTFATLLIAWQNLGYPVTPSERARHEVADQHDHNEPVDEDDIPF